MSSSSERPSQTLADYVVLVFSPALIVGLVCSLAFFLLEVFYQENGPWKGRLQWILFFYVFGAVLVGRISLLGEIAGRAWLYGLVLAFLSYLGLGLFIEYPADAKELSWLINLLLVAVIWWSAHKLARDCTNVDEDTDMSGEGVLQAAGLEETPQRQEEPAEGEAEKKLGWWQRYQRYREERKKKRTLGVWVVYFSLAALPLFGLGQSLIPAGDPRRRTAFWLMTVYVGCGLGLLLTTCFLGLRRYLRQRRLQMPAAMTATWLTVGGGLIVVFVVVGALLPRPNPEYPWLGLGSTGSAKRSASNYAMKGDAPGEGSGRPGAAGRDGKEGGAAGQKDQGKGGPGKEGQGGQGKGGQGGKGKDGQGQSGKGQSGKGESGKGQSGQGESGKGKSGQGESGKGEKGSEKGERRDGKDGQRGSGGQGGQSGKQAGKALKGMGEHGKDEGQKSGTTGSSAGRRLAGLTDLMRKVAPVLKWIVFGLLLLVVLFFVLRGGLQFLAGFTDWARRLLEALRNFWAGLFAGWGGRKTEAEGQEEEEPAPARPERPFASFANPFDTGAADRWKARELVRYTFAALQAWARERDLGRQDGETPLEFSERVAGEVPALEAELRQLAALYARAAYARGALPGNTVEVVRRFWERLERVAAAPLSA